jgi:hypothetical protein
MRPVVVLASTATAWAQALPQPKVGSCLAVRELLRADA